MKKTLFLSLLSLLIFLFQLFRILAEALLASGEFSFLRGFLLFRLHYNRGISFSLLSSSSPEHLSLILLGILSMVGVFFLFQRKKFHLRGLFFWGSLFLLAGGTSNLGERFFYGTVTDYAGFPLPLFGYLFINLADLALLAGAGVMLLSLGKDP